MYFSQQRERSPNVFLYGPRQPLGKSMKHARAGINLHKCNVQLDHFKYNTSFGCHYLTRANFTGRDVASCEKGGCNPGIKTKCSIHGTSEIYPWTGTATHTKTQKKALYQIHSRLFTAYLADNEHVLSAIISSNIINQLHKRSPGFHFLFFCLVIEYATTVLK